MRTLLAVCVSWLLLMQTVLASEGQVGDRYAELALAGRTYNQVRVSQITPQGLIIFHAQGIAQIPFQELPPKLQAHYGYDPEAEAAYLADRQRREAMLPRTQASTAPRTQPVDSILERFGHAPDYQQSVDLRPEFNDLNLHAKDQGRRPSCAVFAVVSALELENARAAGKPEKLSEEYLIWATRETLGIPNVNSPNYDPNRDGDLGFTLIEVVQALRRYGVPEADAMPNTFGKGMAKIEPPDSALIQEARQRREVRATYVTGKSREAQIANIVQALNTGLPVVVGLGWPHEATLRAAPLLSQQIPQYGHAVTLVGYRNDKGKPDDTRFQFKNSWGPAWGINGHGWVTYEYLKKNLRSAVILEVH